MKSVSKASAAVSTAAAFSHVQEEEGLLPQGQASPLTGWFSVAALSQVHCPAGRARHEHLEPVIVFSEEALLHVQWSAFSLPQEHFAWAAQMQLPSREFLQQDKGTWWETILR